MRKLTLSSLLLLAFLAGPAAAAGLPSSVNGDELPTLAPLIEKTSPAVVNISTRGTVKMQQNPLFNDPFFRRFFGDRAPQPREQEKQSLGSGVIIDADEGLIVTNNHVVENADEVTVLLNDNREFTAEVVGTDPRTDVALLRIEADDLVDLPIADSEELRVGDFVVAIGNPFGLNHTVTSGIVSGLGRYGLNNENFEDFIQTDASINPGNSGGALINLRGELVGINTAILSRTGGNIGIGFAIPTAMVNVVVEQIEEYGEVKRGILGVQIQDVTADLALAFDLDKNEGALVANVVPGSAAEEAGLQAGDVVLSLDGVKVTSSSDLRNRVGLMRVGTKVRMEIMRDGKRKTVVATIGDPEENTVAANGLHPALEGATFSELDDRSPLFGQVEGVLVTGVKPGTAAARAGGVGLRPGDVITSVNRKDVGNVGDFRRLVSNTDGGLLLLNIRRGNGALFIAIR
ncbi:MAG: DegQ family serine endoprotease [Gammaproteobacteria bacterium]|nr:DegQ family serine endoprotease [Gammaproteobacteria bacterium]